jgi:hypothetical protein
MESALCSLRQELGTSNPWLFEVTSKAYIRRMASLQVDIATYLAEHPAEVSLILPPLESAVAAVATPSLLTG